MTTAAPEQQPTTIGGYIKEKRGDRPQEDVAELTGFTQAAISAWERGTRIPTARAVAALARALPEATVAEMLALIEGSDQ